MSAGEPPPSWGLSPRGRGNLAGEPRGKLEVGPIPALRGGTILPVPQHRGVAGLSPRWRGNPRHCEPGAE